MEKDKTAAPRNVSSLVPGDRATLSAIRGTGAIRQRLLDLGLLPQVDIEVKRVAPSGNPIWVRVRDMQLSLRREEASSLEICEA